MQVVLRVVHRKDLRLVVILLLGTCFVCLANFSVAHFIVNIDLLKLGLIQLIKLVINL